MTQADLNLFLEKNENIECGIDDEFSYFRNKDLPWYANNPDNCTRVTKDLFKELTPEGLMNEINRGLELEHITRITGYFTKISQWNKGKLGELKDRVRVNKL